MAAISATSAWAVGVTGIGLDTMNTLIERWNGSAWKQVLSPNHAGPLNRRGRRLRPKRLGGRLQ